MGDTDRKQDLQEQALAKSAVLISSSSLSPYTSTLVKGIYFLFFINNCHYCHYWYINNNKLGV